MATKVNTSENETKNMPVDLYFEQEGFALQSKILAAVNESGLPLYVKKLVVNATCDNIVEAINEKIQGFANEYNASQEPKKVLDSENKQGE